MKKQKCACDITGPKAKRIYKGNPKSNNKPTQRKGNRNH